MILNSAKDAVVYNIWFKTDAGTAPGVAGTEVEVDVDTNASAATIAAALGAAIEDIPGFKVNVTGANVEVTCTQPGLATTVASNPSDLTGFTYSLDLAGYDQNMGYSDGDIEVKFDEKLLDITAHQTGADIITSLRQGKITEVTVKMKETDIDNLKLMFGQAGEVWTPSGGSEVVSWGTSTNAENIISKAGKLVLHPVKNGEYFDSPTLTEDLAFWKAYLKPEGLTFSGENPQIVNCSFKVYTDDVKDTRGNIWVLGDHTKDFDADQQS